MRGIKIGDIVSTQDGKYKGKVIDIWSGLDCTDTLTFKIRLELDNKETIIKEIDDIMIF